MHAAGQRNRSRCLRGLFLLAAPLLAGGCGLLDVGNDPTAVEERDVDNVDGALMQRRAALNQFWAAEGQGALYSGVLADEFVAAPYPYVTGYQQIDQRESALFEVHGGFVFEQWPQARVSGALAIKRLSASLPGAPALVGEMFALRGLATLTMGEIFCPGFALNEVRDGQPVFGASLATDEVLAAALPEFDSALVHGTDSAQVLHLAQVGQARALLALGRFAEAGTAAAPVPTAFRADAQYLGSAFAGNPMYENPLYGFVTVADQEAGTGLDFVTAADPRLPLLEVGVAGDGVTPTFTAAKYPDSDAPIVLASGVEARLIEAEAALNAGDANWLTILNALRATEVTPALPALADPGTPAARVDLLFRERAFWLFGTGHRLGDLRRLIARYGRSPAAVFPTGAYPLSGVYGSATAIPFSSITESRNPNVTSCTVR